MQVDRCIQILQEKFGLKYYVYPKENNSELPFAVRLETEISNRKYYSWGVAQEEDLAYFKFET